MASFSVLSDFTCLFQIVNFWRPQSNNITYRIPGIPPYRLVDPLLLPRFDAAVPRGAEQQAAARQKPIRCSKRTQRVAMRLVVHAQQLPHLLRDPD
jgi:hypothetical protein